MLYRELHGRTGLQCNRLRRESFEDSWVLKKTVYWHWDKAGGKFHKTNDPSQLCESETEPSTDNFDLFENSDEGHLYSEYGTKNSCCFATPQRVSWPRGQLQLASMKWEGSSFLWSTPFIRTWLFGFISYCYSSHLLLTEWLKSTIAANHLPVWEIRSPSLGHIELKSTCLRGLCCFLNALGENLLLSLFHFQWSPAFLGSWPLPPSSKPATASLWGLLLSLHSGSLLFLPPLVTCKDCGELLGWRA